MSEYILIVHHSDNIDTAGALLIHHPIPFPSNKHEFNKYDIDAVEQLSPWATTMELVLWSPRATAAKVCAQCALEPVLRNKRNHCNKSLWTATREYLPLAATRENPHSNKTRHSQKYK